MKRTAHFLDLPSVWPDCRQEAESHFLRGMMSWRHGWLAEASSHFEQALSLDPEHAPARLSLHQVALKLAPAGETAPRPLAPFWLSPQLSPIPN